MTTSWTCPASGPCASPAQRPSATPTRMCGAYVQRRLTSYAAYSISAKQLSRQILLLVMPKGSKSGTETLKSHIAHLRANKISQKLLARMLHAGAACTWIEPCVHGYTGALAREKSVRAQRQSMSWNARRARRGFRRRGAVERACALNGGARNRTVTGTSLFATEHAN